MHEKLTPERIHLNYRDYCALPNDGRRYEILDGDLHASPSPETIHPQALLRVAQVVQWQSCDTFTLPLSVEPTVEVDSLWRTPQ